MEQSTLIPLTIPLSRIRIGDRFRRDMGDITSLARSIAEHGLLHPIVVTPDGALIAGERRLRAVQALGWTDVPVTVIALPKLLMAQRDENTCRQDFLPSEAVAIARALEPIEREAARKRQAEHSGTAPERRKNTGGNFPPVWGKSRDKVATAVGISARTLTRARAIVEAAEADPERCESLVKEMDRTGRVNGVYTKLVRMQQAVQVEERATWPADIYDVIAVDPPWPYTARAEDASHRAANPYPSMSLEAITGLPVQALARDDAILWLWVTNAHLPHAFAIAAAWGFEYKTCLTWVKHKMGLGDWLRGQTEHCLMCVRGKPVIQITNQTTVLHAEGREHSRKPDAFYALVEDLCPGAKVELFARTRREGWAAHGGDTSQFIAQ